MTPPLHDEIASVYQHPDWVPSADVGEHGFIMRRSRDLRDMQLALRGRPEGPPNAKNLVLALACSGPNGALRIYYTIAAGSVIVLTWGTKQLQKKDIDAAQKRARVVQSEPSQFKLATLRLA